MFMFSLKLDLYDKNNVQINLSEISILYFICHGSFILIVGLRPVKTYANKRTLLDEK